MPSGNYLNRKHFGVFIALLAAGQACGGDAAAPPTPPTLTVTAGDGQSGMVGERLPLPVTVMVTRKGEPLALVTVSFTVESGGGTLSQSAASTNATGTVTILWTLGGTLGEQTLRATLEGSAPVTIRATASVGPPAQLLQADGNAQFVVVGRAVPVRPKVQVADLYGNKVSGVPVTFSVQPGSGAITDSVQTSDGNGFASPGSWTIGPTPGFNRLRATAGQAMVEFVAIGTPASVIPVQGDRQTANAGTRTGVVPAVMAADGDGKPLPGVAVLFEPEAGGGQVLGGATTTDALGIARPQAWILAPTPGENRLRATVGGVAPVQFTATGAAAVPAQLTPIGPAGFTGFMGNFLPGAPSVRVTDAGGNPVAAVPIVWTAAGGGTVVQRGAAVTDYDGMAAVYGWRLGTDGTQSLTATVTGLPPFAFAATVTAPPASAFQIEVRFPKNTPTSAQRTAFEQAAARWSQVILGDLDDVPFNEAATSCSPALNETIDDVLIIAELTEIDGVGKILGGATPCWIRDDNLLTVVGWMRFDVADLPDMESRGLLNDVILHEMGHVLGIGSLWDLQGMLQGKGGANPFFTGATAQAAFQLAAGPTGYNGQPVPVENSGGTGTRDSHWRESVARNELMTGFIDVGGNPLSAFTATSLRDQGYLVNDAVADAFTLPQFLRSLSAPGLVLNEEGYRWPINRVDRRGRKTGVVPRL